MRRNIHSGISRNGAAFRRAPRDEGAERDGHDRRGDRHLVGGDAAARQRGRQRPQQRLEARLERVDRQRGHPPRRLPDGDWREVYSSALPRLRLLVEHLLRLGDRFVAPAAPPDGSSSPSLRQRRGARTIASQMTPPATSSTNGPNHSSHVVRLDRRVVEHEVAVARDEEVLDLARRSCPRRPARAPRGAGPRRAARWNRRATGSGRRGSAAPPRAASGARRARGRAPARTPACDERHAPSSARAATTSRLTISAARARAAGSSAAALRP